MVETKVQSFHDLQKVVDSLAAKDVTNPFSVTTVDVEGVKNTVSVAGNSGDNIKYKILLEGFNALKSQETFGTGVMAENENDAVEFGGFVPAQTAVKLGMDWIDKFVTQNLGGKREGLKVIWTLPEGRFELDPWTLQLAKS